MSKKMLNTRIQHKHDTEANWLKATNFVPLEGELIIYDADDMNTTPRFKVGDGETVVSSLPFSDENKMDKYKDSSELGTYHELDNHQVPINVAVHGKTTETGSGDKSPNNPYTIGGVNTVSVRAGGKNLCHINDVTVAGYKDFTLPSPLPPGTYTISAHVVSDGTDETHSSIRLGGFDNKLLVIPWFKRNERGAETVTLSKPVYYIRFYAETVVDDSKGDTATWSDVQIEVGDTATDYEPYNANVSEINTILPNGGVLHGNGAVDDTVEMNVLSGCDVKKTIATLEDAVLTDFDASANVIYTDKNVGMVMDNDGTVSVWCGGKNLNSVGDVTVTGYKKFTFEKPIPPGTYTISAYVVSDGTNTSSSTFRLNGLDGSGIKYVYFPRNERHAETVTINESAYSVRIYAEGTVDNSVGDTATWTNVQIERGDTATTYEPYNAEENLPLTAYYRSTTYTPENDIRVCRTTRHWKEIDSYVGETVPDGYVSSTGGLDEGAKIIYPLADAEVYMTDAIELYPPSSLDTDTVTVVASGKSEAEYVGGIGVTSVNGMTGDVIVTDISGNAGSATKLQTGRTLKVDLASTNASTAFNGTENISDIGVSGTLPIANGGTGATTAAAALTNLGITATASELNYVDGVTSSIQTQLDNKLDLTIRGTSIPSGSDLNTYTTPGIYKSNGASISDTLVNTPQVYTGFTLIITQGYSSGYCYQFIFCHNNKFYYRTYNGSNWGDWVNIAEKYTLDSFGVTATAEEINKLDGLTATTTELNYVDGVTSNIQTQLSGKAPTSHASTATTYGVSTASNYGHVMASSTTPKANGTAAVGSETAKFARGDHVHPLQTSVSGNAGTATKLATTRYIDGVSFDGSANVTRYATCSTAAATAAKVASITAGTFSLITGARVTVKFTYANTATSPTLNVGSTGAKAIYWHGAALASSQYWQAGAVLDFVYNGTQWELVGIAKDNNTTYSLSSFSVTATAEEINKLDGLTATTAELNYVDGVTSNIQTQLNDKLSLSGGTAIPSNADLNTYTTPGVYIAGGSSVANSLINPPFTSSGFKLIVIDGYISGRVIQFAVGNGNNWWHRYYSGSSWTEWAVIYDTANKPSLSDLGVTATAAELNKMDGVTATTAELNYVDGVTSNIQSQLNGKAPTSHASTATTYGIGTNSNYGHVKLSDSTSSTSSASSGIAATPSAVKAAYDLANSALKFGYTRITLAEVDEYYDISVPANTAYMVANALDPLVSSTSEMPTDRHEGFKIEEISQGISYPCSYIVPIQCMQGLVPAIINKESYGALILYNHGTYSIQMKNSVNLLFFNPTSSVLTYRLYNGYD